MSGGDGEDVKRSFGERCEGARVAVWRAIRQRRPDEPEMVWADVCVKAWRGVGREAAGRALPSVERKGPARSPWTRSGIDDRLQSRRSLERDLR